MSSRSAVGKSQANRTSKNTNVAATAKARARIARTLQVDADLPPTARERGEISLDRHLRARYIPDQIPFTTLQCAEFLNVDDIEWLADVFHHFSVLSTEEEEALSNVNEDYLKLKNALEDGVEMLNDTSVARKSIISSNCSTRDARSEAYSVMSGSSGVSIKSAIALKGPNRSDLVAQLLKSSPSFVQRRKSYSNKIGTSDRDGDGDKFAISKEWLVELLLGRIARNLPDVPLPTTVGSEQEPAEEACEAETHHAHSNSDGGNPLSMTLKHTTSSASLSSLSSARQLHQRRSKEQRLAIFKEELLQWMRPIVQQCNLHKRPVTWERCEIQASFLEDFHAWVVKQDPYTEPTVPAAAAPTPSFSPLWTKEGTVEPQVGRGARSFSPQAGNTEGGTRLGKVTLLGDDASPNRAGTEDTADAPTAGFSRNASFYSVNSVEGDGGGVPSCYLSYYVRNSDGTPSLTLMDAVEDTNYFVSQVLTRSYQLSCSRGDSSSPARRSRKKKRRAPNEHEYICWSDFTINLIMDDTAAENKTYEDTTYVRVHTVTLEEGAAETPVDIVDDDGDLSDSEDGRDDHLHPTSTLTLGGQRSRTNVNKNKNRGGPDISSQQTELEAFSKELKQLHNMSSDHVVVSPNGQRIYTSSKDSIVKVWEARRGQFIMNLLNVGKAWVMEMFLLHDGQYLMVVTTNAEITVVEVTSGSIVKKMRGCSSLETALSNVVQHSTEHIQRHGMKPGEMGAHRPTYREGMSLDAFMTARQDAQRTTSSTATNFPAQPVEGFVYPTSFYFDSDSCLCFFGTAEGVIGVFDLYDEVQRSALHLGATSGGSHRPVRLLYCLRAHETAITGITYVPLSHCCVSVAEDGTVCRVLVSDDSFGNRKYSFGEVATPIPYAPRHPIRFLRYNASHRYVATSHSDRRVLLWSIGRGFSELIHIFPQETQDVISIVFLSQLQQVGFLLADHSIRIYDFRGHKPNTIISPPVNVENHAMDVASYTLLVSTDDIAEGSLAYIPSMQRVVLALRGPVLYQPLGKVKADRTNAREEVDSPDVDLPLVREEASSPRRRSSESYVASLSQIMKDNDGIDEDTEKQCEDLKRHNYASRVEQRNDDNRRRMQEKLALRRLEPFGTHSRPIQDVVVHLKKEELHTFTADRWKVWDIRTGALKKDIDLSAEVRQVFPMYTRTAMLCCGWTTDLRTRLIVGARNGLAFTLDAETSTVADSEKLLQSTKQEIDKSETDDVTVVSHSGQRTLLCCGRICVVKKYKTGSVLPSGAEESTFMSVKIPVHHATITSCCIVRDAHFCLGTSENRLYLYRMVDRGAPYVDEVLCNLDKGNTPDVGAVIGLYYLNDANQNLIVSVLDTGVVHFYSFIKNIFVGRSRLFKEHTCLLKKVIFSSDSLLICGDSLGVVRIYDLQKFISAQVAGAERRASTAMDVSAASMGSSMVGSEFMTRFSKKERIPLLYVYQGASEEICSLAVYHCSSRSTAGMFIDLNDYTMPTMNAPAPAGILSSKLAGSPTSAVSPTAPTGLLTSSLTSPKTATTAGGSSTTTNHSNNNGSHASRDYFIICGSIDGNVRIHRLYPFNDKQRVSSADKRTEFGQVRTLGLFGVDTWELSDEQTFSDTIVPAQEEARLVAQRQNELLSTLIRQARRLSQPSSTSGEGTPTVAESTLKGTVRTQEATMRSTTKKPLKSTSTSEKTEEPALDETQAQQPFTAPHTLHSLLPVKEVATPLPLQSAKGAGTTVHRKPLEQSKYTRNPLVKSYPMRWLRKIGVAQQVRAEDDDDGDVLVPSDIAFSPESYERLNPFQREIPETSSESSTSALGGPALRRETRRPGRDSTTTFLTAVENMEDYPIASSALRRRSTRQSSASDGGSAGSSRHASVVSMDRRPTMQEQPHSAPPSRPLPAVAEEEVDTNSRQYRILEERRDQLMLSHLAKQLDRSRPKENFNTQLQHRWQERAGEREIAEATRAAVQHRPGARRQEGARSTFSPSATLTRPTGKTGLGLELDLLEKPIEVGASDVTNKEFDTLPVREKIDRTLAEYKRREAATRQERREKAALQNNAADTKGKGLGATYSSPDPFQGNAYLPHVTARQQLHPFSITLPSTMSHDEASKMRLRQLASMVPPVPGVTQSPSSLSKGSPQ